MTYSPTGRGRPCESWERPRPPAPTKRGRPRGHGAAYHDGLRPHGTRAARTRHGAHGEPLCERCTDTLAAPELYLPCGCPRVVGELEETLALPCGYAWAEGVGWIHE